MPTFQLNLDFVCLRLRVYNCVRHNFGLIYIYKSLLLTAELKREKIIKSEKQAQQDNIQDIKKTQKIVSKANVVSLTN